MLRLKLSVVPVAVGIYGPNKNEMPARMRFLHPEAANVFNTTLSSMVIVSDMLRTAESSLEAIRRKRGALPPGYSAHNFGLAIDLDIGGTLKRGRFKNKEHLDAWMESFGWFCHRVDHTIASEAWHFNYLGSFPVLKNVKSRASSIESKIQKLYGQQLTYSDEPGNTAAQQIQMALASLKLYSGAIDGKLGPLSKEAIRVFQRAWGIRESGATDVRTLRTLAFVTCERSIEP